MPASYLVKRGPADPFRGNWYTEAMEFESLEEAIRTAAAKTLENFTELQNSWDEFGYEWSVFEKETGKKIWEGYKFIVTGRGKDLNREHGFL